jgi:hypothetical protein
VALRTNTRTARGHAIDLRIGIGGLPTYIVGLGSALIPINMGIQHQVDVWMTYHPDAPACAGCGWTLSGFGDEFIPPLDLVGRWRLAPTVFTHPVKPMERSKARAAR